ncbi:MAG: type II toxin-antitoxin system Phd/YefM family antitoxin [Deferrisomatales bacterium]|nr:type II toxin-antitoxin system Phd/YefM family antitoxin [Deferrisomatales bacterium]
MTRIGATEARAKWADLLDQVIFRHERVIVERRNKAVAIVPVEDLELLRRLEDRTDAREAQAALDEMGEEPGTTWEELRKELGL